MKTLSKNKLRSYSVKWIDRFIILFLFAVVQSVAVTQAQGILRGSNMAEFQLGNIPGLKPMDQTSLYDQLNLLYRVKSLSLKARIEQYYPSFGDNKSYTSLSQYKIEYKTKNLNLSVGHLYTILGRGLLLRTYEIPGSIWETRGYRVRYGFYRDLKGIELKYRLKKFELKAIRGRVLDVTLPPTIEKDMERRPDLVEGGELRYNFKNQKAGFTYMRQTNASKSTGYASVYFDGNLFKNVSFYSEFARRLDSTSLFLLPGNAGFGAYASFTYAHNRIGVSLEFKDYQNMSIGAGISDPPTLVKEQSYRLLNRSTHVPELTNESGYQLEIYYRFANNSMLTLNHALAKNKISPEKSSVFTEYFAEYRFSAGEKFSGQAFADYSRAPFINENNRYAGGFLLELDHNSGMNSSLETELQYVERIINKTVSFLNAYLAYTFSMTSKYSASLVYEYTGDPVQVENNKNYNYYPAVSLSYRPDSHNQIALFFGKRRGGLACTSGVCYDVLDFEGLEIRLLTRF